MCINQCVLKNLEKKMFLHLFKSSGKIRLGRWSVVSSKKIMDRKVELANHDNCGPCPPIKKYELEAYNNSMDIAVCALQSLHETKKKN